MKQPHNFASVLEGSLQDGPFVLDLLSSHPGIQYDLDPNLVAKVIASLTLDERAHVLLHARLQEMLSVDTQLCARLLDVLPLHIAVDEVSGESRDAVMLLMDAFDNVLIYSLLVRALCNDNVERGRRSKMAISCYFQGLERKPSQLIVCEAIYTPFKYEMSWLYRDASMELLKAVCQMNGMRCFAERVSAELTENQFVVLCRHIVDIDQRLALLIEYMLVNNMTDAKDVSKCALQMRNVDQKSEIKFEFLKTILMSRSTDEQLKAEIKKKNKSL